MKKRTRFVVLGAFLALAALLSSQNAALAGTLVHAGVNGEQNNTLLIVSVIVIVLGAAAMLGMTTIGALAAGKKKPGFMYEPSPALGRRGRGKLRPRGW